MKVVELLGTSVFHSIDYCKILSGLKMYPNVSESNICETLHSPGTKPSTVRTTMVNDTEEIHVFYFGDKRKVV